MKRTHRSLSKRLLLAAGIIVLVLAVGAGAFFWYVSDYYRAQDTALEVLAQGTGISARDGLTILSPSYATDTALIFYPGAKVEAEAYLPLLDQIRSKVVTCILVHMPFHMAIFDPGAAEDVIRQFPQIRHWYIAGHSMGGAMASKFASEHPDMVEGADPSGRVPLWGLSGRGYSHGLRLVESKRGGSHQLHGKRRGNRRRQSCPIRQLWAAEGGSARRHLCAGPAGTDGRSDCEFS